MVSMMFNKTAYVSSYCHWVLTATGLLVALGFPGSASADVLEETYVGVAPMGWEFEERELDPARDVGGRITGGAMFTPYLGVEAHFGMGGKTEVDSIEVELDSMDSVLLRLNAPLHWSFQTYILTGFSTATMVVTPETVDGSSETASGFSLGVGAELRTPRRFALSIDAVRYLDEPGFMFQAATISLKWRF